MGLPREKEIKIAVRKGGLDKWFKEKWVDISRPKKGGGFEPCGRGTPIRANTRNVFLLPEPLQCLKKKSPRQFAVNARLKARPRGRVKSQ